MNILIYTLKNGENGAEKIHLEGVLSKLYIKGHSILYVDGRRYSPSPVKEIEPETGGRRQRSIWGGIKGFLATTPLRGEALVLWLALKELRLFVMAGMTVFQHKPEVIYRRHTLFNSDFLIARVLKIPSIREVNGITTEEVRFTKRADKITQRVIEWIERFNLSKADKVIAVTPKMKDLLHSKYKIGLNNIIVIPNGADTDLFKPANTLMARKTLGLAQDTNYACFVGSLGQWQGVQYLIQSLPLILGQCPNTQLLIVGDGPMKEELFKLAEKTGVSNKTIFTGTVAYYKVPLYINASDICISLKTGLEFGFSPLKLCEYLACGKPVVASRDSGLEIVEDSGSGILVDPKDVGSIAIAIITLLKNPELRIQMGENSRRYVIEHRSWAGVAEKVAGVCQVLIGSKRDGDTR